MRIPSFVSLQFCLLKVCSVFTGPQKTVILLVLKMGSGISGSSFLEWSGYLDWILVVYGKKIGLNALLSIITENFFTDLGEAAKGEAYIFVLFLYKICDPKADREKKKDFSGTSITFFDITYSAFHFYFL